MTVYINGKFLAQTMSGVQRVARSLVLALDAHAMAQAQSWVLLHPPGAVPPQLQRIRTKPLGSASLPLHLWEQLVLPWAARDGLLINLAGSAPALARRQLCQVHDAAIYDTPVTYTPAFVLWYRLLFACLAWRGTTFLTVSKFSQARLARHLDISADRIRVLSSGTDHLDSMPDETSILHRPPLSGRCYLLVVASASASKNVQRLLQAFALLGPAADGAALVWVCGRHDAVFRAIPDAPDAAEWLVQVQGISDGELKSLYQHAIGLVVPSLYEGYGLPSVEAMRLGCPVLAAAVPALIEVCGDAALFVDPLSVPALAAAMRRLLGDAGLRAQLRAAGLERTRDALWARTAAQLTQVVDEAGCL